MLANNNVHPITGKLCSTASLFPAYVRFINFTSFNVRIYWLDYQGRKRLYNTIATDEYLDVNTFVGHLWVFENGSTGDSLLGGWNFVFYPESSGKEKERANVMYSNREGEQVPVRRVIPITYPVYSLKARAMQAVRDAMCKFTDMTGDYWRGLEIPVSLKKELQVILRRKNCILKHQPNCDCST